MYDTKLMIAVYRCTEHPFFLRLEARHSRSDQAIYVSR
jgi:hypothetical protein